MLNRAAIFALIPALLVAVFIAIVVSSASGAVKVVAGIVFLGGSVALLYKAGTLMRS